jgi:hypothetical protein
MARGAGRGSAKRGARLLLLLLLLLAAKPTVRDWREVLARLLLARRRLGSCRENAGLGEAKGVDSSAGM